MNKEFNSYETLSAIIGNIAGATLKKGKNWRVDIAERIIEYPESATNYNNQFYDSSIGGLLHESGHLAYTTTPSLLRGKLKKSPFSENVFKLLNSIEDIRIENLICKKYKGAKEYLMASQENANTAISRFKKDDIDLATRFILAPHFLPKVNERARNYDASNFINNSPVKLMKLFTSEMIDDLVKGTNASSTMALYEILEQRAIPALLSLLGTTPQEQQEILEQLKKTLANGNDKEKVIPSTRFSSEKTNNKMAEKMAGKGLKASSQKSKYNNRLPTRSQLNQILSKSRLLYAGVNNALSILKDIELKRDEINLKSGRINQRKLFKLFSTPQGNNPRVFKKARLEQETQDIAVSILCDISGSMGGDRALQASIGAEVLGTALSRAGKDFAIFGFNEKLEIFKGFGDKYNPSQAVSILANTGGGTALFTPLMRVLAITKRDKPDKRPYIFVLSDGETSLGGGYNENNEYDRSANVETCKVFAKKLNATIIPIGIQHDNLKKYFKDTETIIDSQELPKVFTKHFRQIAGKRIRV